jgi:hypothetical protein
MAKIKVKEFICKHCTKRWQIQNGIMVFNSFSFLPSNKSVKDVCPLCKPPEIEVVVRPESAIIDLAKNRNELW